MSDPEAYLECRCGECRIVLCDPTMRSRAECLCSDCRKRGLISASRAPENTFPAAVANFERGVELVYFANAFIVDEASCEKLEFSKLSKDAANTTAMSTCCGTLMCGTHPMYQGKTVSVNADSCRVTVPSKVATQAIVFACDIPDERAKEIEAQSSVPVIYDVFASLDHPVLQKFVKDVTAEISDDALALANTSFEKLCAEKTIVIEDFRSEAT